MRDRDHDRGDAPVPRAHAEGEPDENGFSWGPIQEVAKLFAGIFIAIIPVLAMLQAGRRAPSRRSSRLVTNPDGSPNNAAYFWLAGGLRPSSTMRRPISCSSSSRAAIRSS